MYPIKRRRKGLDYVAGLPRRYLVVDKPGTDGTFPDIFTAWHDLALGVGIMWRIMLRNAAMRSILRRSILKKEKTSRLSPVYLNAIIAEGARPIDPVSVDFMGFCSCEHRVDLLNRYGNALLISICHVD